MRTKSLAFALAMAIGLLGASSSQAAIVLNFNGNPGTNIVFTGNGTSSTVTITPQTNPQFTVASASGGDGSGVGITGSILSSTGFTYTTAGITTSGPVQSALLSGAGTLTLQKGGETLTATIVGAQISTFLGIGGVNSAGTVNLSNLALTGSGNNDLTQLYNNAISSGGIATISFQFVPAQNLTDLAKSGTNTTTFSGTVTTAVPEPGTMAMAFTALALSGLARLRRRKQV